MPAALLKPALLWEPTPPRGLSLVDRLDEIDTILETLESLEDTEHSDTFREELQKQLIGAIAGTRDKVDRTGSALAALESGAAAAKLEMEHQRQRYDRFNARAESLEGYLLAIFAASPGLKQLDGHRVTFTARDNPQAVTIDDAAQVPPAFMRTPTPPPPPEAVPDKIAIKAALQIDPAAVAGCRLTRGVRLVRK